MTARAAYHYDAFGLYIASDFPLPELRAAAIGAANNHAPDLTIRDRPIGRAIPPREDGVLMDYTCRDGAVMAWPEVAGFRIVDERTIWAEKPETTTDRMLAFPLLGPVMAWLLNARGLFVLHASAVEVEGRTIGFLGDKMAGKSTTAAAFIRAGHPLVTDDLLAIDVAKGAPPRCYPAFPQLKLEDTAAAAITIDGSDAQPLVYDGFPKRQHKLPGMATSATSIDCLVRLQRGGDRPAFIPADMPGAIETITRFSYMPRFANAPWTQDDNRKHFSQTIGLADSALIGTLQVPDDLTRLDETVDLVAKMLRELPA